MFLAASSAVAVSLISASVEIALALSCSLMVLITSHIIESGVEAPATIPIIIAGFLNKSIGISSLFETILEEMQFFLHISSNFFVFELCRSPKTRIAPHFWLSCSASACLSKVVLQMVLLTRMPGYSSLILSSIAVKSFESKVV